MCSCGLPSAKGNRPSGKLTADKTSLAVSVTGQSQKPVTKQSDRPEIDWTVVETQLVEWRDLLQAGKKLWIDVTFHYLVLVDLVIGLSVSKWHISGRVFTTQRMLRERSARL